MDFEFIAEQFSDHVVSTTNITEPGIIFIAENVSDLLYSLVSFPPLSLHTVLFVLRKEEGTMPNWFQASPLIIKKTSFSYYSGPLINLNGLRSEGS